MEQENPATPSPRSKENNPLESSKFTSKGKATTAIDHRHGVTHETSSPIRQSRASASSQGKQIFGHSIKSLLPHSTRSTLGKSRRIIREALCHSHSKDNLPALCPLSCHCLRTSSQKRMSSTPDRQLHTSKSWSEGRMPHHLPGSPRMTG
jgi:hypothetical protein